MASKKSVGNLRGCDPGHALACHPFTGWTTWGSEAMSSVVSLPSQHEGKVISDLMMIMVVMVMMMIFDLIPPEKGSSAVTACMTAYLMPPEQSSGWGGNPGLLLSPSWPRHLWLT